MKNGLILVLLTALGTVLGGWFLVWLPADAVVASIRTLGDVNFSAWISAPVQLPAWYFALSIPILVSLSIWAGTSLIRYSARKRQAARPRLSKDECLVLKIICEYGEHKQQPTASELARSSGLSILRTEHALEQLVSIDMITFVVSMSVGPKYFLRSDGRSYLLRANTH